MFAANSKTIKYPTILIFDSGVGGLSIYNEVRKTLPDAYYLYVFDNEAFPYGEKPEWFIITRVIAIIDAIWRLHHLDIIIVACNTASTITLPILRKRFSCAIIGVVPAIKLAAELAHNKVIGLLATRGTIRHRYTHDLIKQFANDCQILQIGTTKLVYLAEAKLHGKTVPYSELQKLLSPWLRAVAPPSTIVLGCTHFPLIRKELKSVLPKNTQLIDSGAAVARRAAWIAKNNIDCSSIQEKVGPNIVYCLAITPQATLLMRTLMRYGFGSFRKLSI